MLEGSRAAARRRGRSRCRLAHRRGARRAARRARRRRRGGWPSRAADGGAARLHIDRVFTIRGAGHGGHRDAVVGRDRARRRAGGAARRPARARPRRPGPRPAARARRRRPAGGGEPDGRGRRRGRAAATWSSPRRRGRAARLSARRRAASSPTRIPSTATACRSTTGPARRRRGWRGSAGASGRSALEQPLVAAAGDRLVVRQIAPPDTLGGGRVLDPRPRKHGPSRDLLTRLELLSRGEPPEPEPRPTPTRRAEPPPAATEPEPLSASALALERRLRDAGFEPPLDSELDAGDLAALREAGRAIRVSRSLHYHPDALADVRRRVIADRRRARGLDHAGPAARRARDLAQVRPGAARAPRRREGHDPPRRPARGPPQRADRLSVPSRTRAIPRPPGAPSGRRPLRRCARGRDSPRRTSGSHSSARRPRAARTCSRPPRPAP